MRDASAPPPLRIVSRVTPEAGTSLALDNGNAAAAGSI